MSTSEPTDKEPTGKEPTDKEPGRMEKAHKRGWFTLIGGIGACVLTLIGHVLIREWYSPDVRYEEEAYYRSGEEAITSLKLHNYGADGAKDITISVSFPKPITKFPVSSSEASPFIMMSSVPPKQHPMQQTVVGTIKRLAPG